MGIDAQRPSPLPLWPSWLCACNAHLVFSPLGQLLKYETFISGLEIFLVLVGFFYFFGFKVNIVVFCACAKKSRASRSFLFFFGSPPLFCPNPLSHEFAKNGRFPSPLNLFSIHTTYFSLTTGKRKKNLAWVIKQGECVHESVWEKRTQRRVKKKGP